LAPTRQLWRQRRALVSWWRQRAIEDRWLLTWFTLPLLVFFFARSRLPLYILPLLVPLALVIARRWQADQPLPIRRIAAIAAVSATLLMALKIGLPLAPHPKDTREMAAAIRVHWPDPGEIVFIEETALYGLRFYLGVPVERVTLTQKSDPAYDSLLLEELDEHENRVFITTQTRIERIRQTLAPVGLRFVEEQRIERYVLGRIEADT